MDPKLLEMILARALKPAGDDRLMALGQATLVLADGDQARAEEIKARLDSSGGFQAKSREELDPQEGDFIYPVYRLISQVVMECYGLDYRRPGMLEAAVPLAQNKTIYPDHRAEVEGWIGKVESAWWDEPGQTGTPLDVAGINGRLKVDWKANPKIARGILTGILDSVSFTNTFRWQKSHPDLRDWQFWEMLGREVDGRPVLIDVMEIVSFDELSIVWAGADSRAKKVSASETQISGAELQITESTAFLPPPGGAIKTLIEGEEMDPRLMAILAALKAETPEEALKRVQELAAQPAPDAAMMELGKQLAAQGVKPGEAPALVEAGKLYREQLTDELDAFATLALGDPESGNLLPDGFKESAAKLSTQQLAAQVKFYKVQAEKKYPQRCQQCGSTNVTSQVSAQPELGEGKEGKQQKRKLDLSNIHR